MFNFVVTIWREWQHIMLYNCFDWSPPNFGHLPLLLNPDRTKISKRQQGTSVEYYRDKGCVCGEASQRHPLRSTLGTSILPLSILLPYWDGLHVDCGTNVTPTVTTRRVIWVKWWRSMIWSKYFHWIVSPDRVRLWTKKRYIWIFKIIFFLRHL